jgi:hypothetical protein
MKKWRSLAEDGHPPVGTVCAYGVDDCDSNENNYTVWAKGDQVEILAYRDDYAVVYNHTREAADIRNLDYGDEGPLVVALDEESNPKEWNGEGLPPAGAVCEIAESSEHLSIRYQAGTVVRIYANFTDDRGVELAAFVDDFGRVGGVAIAKCFRPIRSEEDRAVDDVKQLAIDAFKAKHPDRHAPCTAIEITIRAMHQLGYRKQEKK